MFKHIDSIYRKYPSLFFTFLGGFVLIIVNALFGNEGVIIYLLIVITILAIFLEQANKA